MSGSFISVLENKRPSPEFFFR